MDNKEMVTAAINMLEEIDLEEVEAVQIENTKYDDGSTGFTVDITFPRK